MASRPPSIRQIAQLTGLSKATVANALKDSLTVAPATARRVLAAAEKIGYKRNPMVGTLMSALRRSQGASLQGVLAVVDIAEPDRPEHGPFHRELMAGCKGRAGEFGFKLESYEIERAKLSAERLDSILKARGIRGLIILPSWRAPDFTKFDWSWYAGVYTDYTVERPILHSVCSDHYRSMIELLEVLYARGYRRPGLFLEAGRDERIHLRMSAAFRAFQASHADLQVVEPYFAPRLSNEILTTWLKRTEPEVVLSHHCDVLTRMEETGLRIPQTHGFVSLNLAKARKNCAGLDLRPRQIGRCAVELLIGQIQRDAWGLPECAMTTMITANFIEGPTLRPLPEP